MLRLVSLLRLPRVPVPRVAAPSAILPQLPFHVPVAPLHTAQQPPPQHSLQNLTAVNAKLKTLLDDRRFDTAFDTYVDMPDESCTPSMHTYQLMIEGMAGADRPDLVQAIHEDVVRTGRLLGPRMYVALLLIYGRYRNAVKCIAIQRAIEQSGTELNIPMYGALVFSNYVNGRVAEALSIVEQYRLSGLPMPLLYHHMMKGFRKPSFSTWGPIDADMASLRERLLVDLAASLGTSSTPVSSEEVHTVAMRAIKNGSGLLSPVLELAKYPHLLDLLLPDALNAMVIMLYRTSRIPPDRADETKSLMVWLKNTVLSNPECVTSPILLSRMLSYFLDSGELDHAYDVLRAAEAEGVQFTHFRWLNQLTQAVADTPDPAAKAGLSAQLARWEEVLLAPATRTQFLEAQKQKTKQDNKK